MVDDGIERDGKGRFRKGGKGGPGRLPSDPTKRIDRMYLAGAIRNMLESEHDDDSGRVKLLELIHVAYEKAKSGDSDAMKLLFERGYGKTPPVYQLDPRVLLEQLCVQHGLTIDDVKSDPIAAYFFGLLDGGGDGQAGLIEAAPRDEARAGSIATDEILEPD